MGRMMKGSIIAVLCLIFSMTVAHGVQEPSQWAVTEVESAIQANIIPEQFQKNYQQNIKRHEYVLLALSIYESTSKRIEVTKQHPFYDVVDHPYEEDIVKAYAAGLIRGNGDGTFNPDGEITRQEIASLVVHLIKNLNSSLEVKAEGMPIYADQEMIAPWAYEYIAYCYEQGIIKGTGMDSQGRPIINPRGKATREEAIVLLYRLFNNEAIMHENSLGTVEVVDPIRSLESQRIFMQTDLIQDFAWNFDKDIARHVQQLSQEQAYTLLTIDEMSLILELPQQASLSLAIVNDVRLYNLSFLFYDVQAEKIFKETVSKRIEQQSLWTAYEQIKEQLKVQESATIRIDNRHTLFGQKDEIVENMYHIELRESK